MNIPAELKYSKEHEWLRIEGDTATVGITAFAQGELGDIIYVDIDTVGEAIAKDAIFGTVEAVKTVSDLFLPVSGEVIEFNEALKDKPELAPLRLEQQAASRATSIVVIARHEAIF